MVQVGYLLEKLPQTSVDSQSISIFVSGSGRIPAGKTTANLCRQMEYKHICEWFRTDTSWKNYRKPLQQTEYKHIYEWFRTDTSWKNYRKPLQTDGV